MNVHLYGYLPQSGPHTVTIEPIFGIVHEETFMRAEFNSGSDEFGRKRYRKEIFILGNNSVLSNSSDIRNEYRQSQCWMWLTKIGRFKAKRAVSDEKLRMESITYER